MTEQPDVATFVAVTALEEIAELSLELETRGAPARARQGLRLTASLAELLDDAFPVPAGPLEAVGAA